MKTRNFIENNRLAIEPIYANIYPNLGNDI